MGINGGNYVRSGLYTENCTGSRAARIFESRGWDGSHAGSSSVAAIFAVGAGGNDHHYADKRIAFVSGFHIEAIEMLLGERNAMGIFVDTLSLDYGQFADFNPCSTMF
jgi:hypothetical protein